MKRIVVACGSGVATSETVALKLKRMLESEEIEAQIDAVDVKSVHLYLKNADAYVQIVPEKETYEVPIVSGLPFLTGVGAGQEFEKLKKYLKD